MDCIYLAQKFSKPLPWESWVSVRQVVDFVCTQVDEQDLSIWEVRGKKKNFLYSKVMMWCVTLLRATRSRAKDGRVAIDRGLRLAEKRCLPCPNREHWRDTRDKLYEDVQKHGWK